MPLSFMTYSDITITYIYAGPADGTPSDQSVGVTVVANTLRVRETVQRIESGGFQQYNRSRPGRLSYELELEVDVPYNGDRLIAEPGHYAAISFTAPDGTFLSFYMLIVEEELSVSVDDRLVQRIRLEGAADS
ncbi:MAG: hypothetical protein RMJ43_03255 [Chloroherpetonaceae bacterium]|nr:hypothetical protein [Chloroherpetonaceae bacterium]